MSKLKKLSVLIQTNGSTHTCDECIHGPKYGKYCRKTRQSLVAHANEHGNMHMHIIGDGSRRKSPIIYIPDNCPIITGKLPKTEFVFR